MWQNRRQWTSNKQQRQLIWLGVGLAGVMAMACLACGLVVVVFALAGGLRGSSQLAASRQTPLPDPAETTLPVIRDTPTPTSTPLPTPTPTITPTPLGSTPVAVEAAEGWSFEGVRVQPDPSLGGLLVYGEAINNAGAPQRILGLQAALYSSQGQAITLEETDDYWPIETVPFEGRMPFELTVFGPTEADRVELQVATEPGDPPRTDFELTEVEGKEQEADYCVTGQVRNLGQPLAEYLMVVAVLYDEDDRVINWGIGYESAPTTLVGNETLIVGACAERFNRLVARHELRAWGL